MVLSIEGEMADGVLQIIRASYLLELHHPLLRVCNSMGITVVEELCLDLIEQSIWGYRLVQPDTVAKLRDSRGDTLLLICYCQAEYLGTEVHGFDDSVCATVRYKDAHLLLVENLSLRSPLDYHHVLHVFGFLQELTV